MKALIDADMPAMELGGLSDYPDPPHTIETDEDGKDHAYDENRIEIFKEPLPWNLVRPLAKGRFFSILIKSEAGGYKAFLSRGATFRHKLATLLGYKANRDKVVRPYWADSIKDYYRDELGAEFCDGYEADDAMAMEQWADWSYLARLSGNNERYIKDNASTVICSRDKDLDTVPGWHFKWTLKREQAKREALGEVDVEKPPYYVTLIDSIRNFYKQLLTGDTVDNIKGLYNIGPKSAWVKQLQDMDSEPEMYEHVKEKYKKYYGNYSDKFLVENARLLHMWRKKDDVWLPPPERGDGYYDI